MKKSYFENVMNYQDSLDYAKSGMRKHILTRHFKLFCRLDIYAHRAMFGRNQAHKQAILALLKRKDVP